MATEEEGRTERVLRISQLDVLELDNELINILQEKFFGIFKFLPSTSLIEKLRPELKILLHFLIWKWSLGGKSESTFGQEMMSLKYMQLNRSPLLTSNQKRMILLLHALPTWISERFEDLLNLMFPRLRADRIFNCIKAFLQLFNLFNFCSFILRGRYPSLIERLLGVVMTPQRPQALRELSYDYMNREILWYGFSEFLFSVLPLMNLPHLRNVFRETFHRLIQQREETLTPVTNQCVLCESVPVMAQLTNCGHIYCYYCVAANVLADSSFPCALCHEKVVSFVHWNGKTFVSD